MLSVEVLCKTAFIRFHSVAAILLIDNWNGLIRFTCILKEKKDKIPKYHHFLNENATETIFLKYTENTP